MRRPFALLLPLLAASSAPFAQQFDMEAIQRWTNVKTVHYKFSGVFDGWASVSTYKPAEGKVGDTAMVEFDWNVRERKIISEPNFQNGDSTVGELRDRAECTTPVLNGHYEHVTVTGVTANDMGQVAIVGTRTFPAVKAATECPASKALNPVAAGVEAITEYIAVPDPGIMATAGMGQTMPNVSFTADKKSLVLKTGGWTWTVTPTPLIRGQ